MTAFVNAKLVTADAVIETELRLDGPLIAAVGEGCGDLDAIDCEGDYLIPGIVDLHTDNLERQVLPRADTRWPSVSAFIAHDAQCAMAGVTTVLDSLRMGRINNIDGDQTAADAVRDLVNLADAGVLRSEHYIHLRCELIDPRMIMLFRAAVEQERVKRLVRLVSVMDHSPGIGQFSDVDRWRRSRAKEGMSPDDVEGLLARLRLNRERHSKANRDDVVGFCIEHSIPIASHDDRLAQEVLCNHHDGISISEFPVSIEAARAARSLALDVVAGAPNVVRGGSHSGNVGALDLIRAGLVTALASDYVPGAMLEAAFACASEGVLSLPEAVALVTARPAEMVGLADRGRIAPGRRGDLVQVRLHGSLPVVRRVWVGGRVVA